jgi:glycosyltransferase involved in cell wall biosynthesis
VSPVEASSSPTVFFAFRDAPERRLALDEEPGALERYRLFGLDQIAARGARVWHNLEQPPPPAAWARTASTALNAVVYRSGGYGGDFASILPALRRANGADVIFSTVDTVGLPLVLLKRAGLVRPPLVYTSIGLPERLAQLRGSRVGRTYASALGRAHTIVAYAQSETDRLREWLGDGAPRVLFVPFGVDADAFRPEPELEPKDDVVSVGADPRRDFELLVGVASRQPGRRFRIVTTADRMRSLGPLPANVAVETDLPLAAVRDRLAAARVVALPVRDNSYSGGTTVLLQAMAMGKPVVVSRTEAIAEGYGLADDVNCRLVPPGDAAALENALLDVLTGGDAGASLGIHARQTIERDFSWERYTDALWEILTAAARS